MSQFAYEARDEHGTLVAGLINADSMADAGRQLSGRGQFVIRLGPVEEEGAQRGGLNLSFGGGGRGVRRKDVMWFMSQLSVMIEAGIPLGEALECLSRQNLSDPCVKVFSGISKSVQEGRPLSDSMADYPRAFSPTVISLVRASEASGTMSMILGQISQFLVREEQVISRVRGALLYPALMFVLCMSVTTFLMIAILPKFTEIFVSRGAALPTPTLWLMWVGNGLADYWPHLLAGLFLTGLTLVLGMRTQGGRALRDRIVLSLPVIGGIARGIQQSRACLTLGTLLRAGVPLIDTLTLVKRSAGNVHFERLWDEVIAGMRQGERLAGPLLASPWIAEPVAQMIDAGDRAGRLSQVFQRLAGMLEEEYDQAIKRATQLIEPTMIVVMGVLIGFIAISLLLPLFGAGKAMAGG